MLMYKAEFPGWKNKENEISIQQSGYTLLFTERTKQLE